MNIFRLHIFLNNYFQAINFTQILYILKQLNTNRQSIGKLYKIKPRHLYNNKQNKKDKLKSKLDIQFILINFSIN